MGAERHANGHRLAERARAGAADAELAHRDPAQAPRLLGWFTAASPREVILRRTLLGLRTPPQVVAALERLLPGRPRKLWSDFASNYAYWSAVRRRLTADEWRQLARGVPVLLYHAFSEHDESNRFILTRRAFARQMRLLSLLGFSVIPYGEFAEAFREGRLPPRRTAVLTIDDGYADTADIAVPVLERHRFRATVYLVSQRLGGTSDWSDSPPLDGRALLSVGQLEHLASRGIEFGAHTRTHCSLPDASDAAVADEVELSRTDLEAALGTSVVTFAYPYGRLDDRAVAAVERAGYVSACTTEARLARLDDDPLRVPRLEIKRSDSLPRFLLKVWLGAG